MQLQPLKNRQTLTISLNILPFLLVESPQKRVFENCVDKFDSKVNIVLTVTVESLLYIL